MANTYAPFGAADFMHQGGSQRTEELRQVWIASSEATPIFNGDLVQFTNVYVSTGLLTGGFGPYVVQATSGLNTSSGTLAGIFRGCELYNTALQKMYYSRYWPGQSAAGTSSQTGDIKAYIVSDRAQRFLIQTSTDLVLGASNIGNLYGVGVSTAAGQLAALGKSASAAGNTVTGNSGMALIATTLVNISSQTGLGTISTAVFQLVDFYSNWGPGLLPGMVPGSGTGQFVNGMDNTTPAQYVVVVPYNWAGAV
jgi:hypothetical protein